MPHNRSGPGWGRGREGGYPCPGWEESGRRGEVEGGGGGGGGRKRGDTPAMARGEEGSGGEGRREGALSWRGYPVLAWIPLSPLPLPLWTDTHL